MRDILIDLNAFDKNETYNGNIIREGENKASRFLITLSPEFTGYSYKLKFKLNDNTPLLSEDLVPVDGVITYEITNANTFEIGTLKTELQAYNVDNVLIKSAIIFLKITESVDGLAIEVPSDYEIYVHMVEHYMDNDMYDPTRVEADAFDMENMVDGTTKVAMTKVERDKLDAIEGSVETIPDTYVVRNSTGSIHGSTINFDTNPTTDPKTKAHMQWSEANGTVTIGIGTASIEINQAQFLKAHNMVGRTLMVGEVVTLSGAINDVPSIVLADADGNSNAQNVLGVVSTEPILDGQIGSVLIHGLVHNVDTSLFNVGDSLFLSTVGGQVVATAPSPPAVPIFVGYCIKQSLAGQYDGIVYVKPNKIPVATQIAQFDAGDYFTGDTVEDALQEIGGKMKTSFGEMYLYNGNTAQSIPLGTTYTKITPFFASGEVLNCNVDHANQQIIISRKGKYRVTGTFSSKLDSNGNTLETTLFKNGVEIPKLHVIRKISVAGEPSTGSMTCILDCNIGDIIDIRVRHDRNGAVGLTVMYGNLNVTKIVG